MRADELPSKEEIEMHKDSCKYFSNDTEEEETEDEEENGEVAHAKAVAEEFGKSSKSKNVSSSMELDDEVAEGLKELDMDNYDEEDDENLKTQFMLSLCTTKLDFPLLCLDSGIEIFSSGRGDLYYKSNEMDPYLKRNDDHDDDSDDDPPILPTDLVIVCAMTDDKEANRLDVWNFLAVGSDGTPTIEIWDLDAWFDMLPCVQLGGQNKEGNYKQGSHTRSVLGLAWNKEFRNILASASADKKVKVWDVATGTCKITMEHHTKEVQAVAWNHYAPEVLLSGSFDQTVVLVNVLFHGLFHKDGRQPSHSGFKWSVMSDVESLAWDPHSEHSFVMELSRALMYVKPPFQPLNQIQASLLMDMTKQLLPSHTTFRHLIAAILTLGKKKVPQKQTNLQLLNPKPTKVLTLFVAHLRSSLSIKFVPRKLGPVSKRKMITAVSWIPKGNLKAVPDVAEPPSKEELKELIESGAFARNVEGSNEDEEEEIEEDGEEISEVDHAKAVAEALGKSSKSKAVSSSMEVDEVSQGLKELDMDNYDEEDDGTFSWPFGVCSAILQVIILISRDKIELFSSGMGDLYYPSNEMDPYLKDVDDEDDEEDIDDTTVKPTDSVIICARNEDDVSHLEVYLYEESSGSPNMYVHHHIIIPEFPLCTAWLDCPLKGGEKGNFVAIGSKDTPTIEIWDLDVRDEVLPCIQLGGIEEMIVSKKKKSKKQKPVCASNSSISSSSMASSNSKKVAILSQYLVLLGTRSFGMSKLTSVSDFLLICLDKRNILASASADKKVKVWDVATGTCKITMEHHTKEVQAVAWNHYAPEVLLSGSFDQTVVMKDGRQPSHSGFKWSVMSDVESLAWDPHCEHSFVVHDTYLFLQIDKSVVSLEDGTVKGFDIRAAQSGSDSDLNPTYTIQAHAQDRGVSSISYNISTPNGAVFSISFAVDNPFLLAIGGSKGELHVWDTLLDANVARKYGSNRS
ncbi:putative protein [Arabidopsis thaliana]|uniref:Uncharacterized protein AT4g18900 n=1 Tax=Arabidopsis thaliana TaxID=3702 RepID=O49405_ARATH|nr:putative protein [Arabidopsis thaliana]CAB78892.1 putative protein [Arabidopsis thaliana]